MAREVVARDVVVPVSGPLPGDSSVASEPGADPLHRALRSTGLLTVAGLGVGIGTFAFTVAVARLGGASSYGIVSALVAVATAVGFLASGIQYTVARRVAAGEWGVHDLWHRGRQGLTAPRVAGGGALMAAAAAVAWPLAHYLHLTSVVPVVLTLVATTVMLVGAAPLGVLLGLRAFGWMAVAMVAAPVVRLATVVPFAAAVDTADAAMLATLVGVVAGLVVTATGVVIHLRRAGAQATPGATAMGASFGAESGVSAWGAAVIWAIWSTPLFFARHGLDAAAAGRFAAVQTLASAVLYLSGAAVAAFFPSIAGRGDRRLVAAQLLSVAGIAGVGLVGLLALGPFLLRHLYGADFGEGHGLFAVLGASALATALLTSGFWTTRALTLPAAWVGLPLTAALVAEVVVAALAGRSTMTLAAEPGVAAVVAALGAIAVGVGAAALLRGVTVVRRVLGPARRSVAFLGVLLVVVLSGVAEQPWGEAVALAAFAALATATVLGALEAWGAGRRRRSGPVGGPAGVWTPTHTTAGGPARAAALVVAGVCAAMVQTWFGGWDTALAGGDNTLPDGTAWIGHLFDPWSKDVYGGPNGSAVLLPWAAVLRSVTWLGGSPALAERLWLTGLVVGAGLAAFWLLRLLGVGPAAAAVGALASIVNPFTLSVVGFSTVYWGAVLLVALIPALLVALARRRLSPPLGLLAVLPLAALVGFVDLNPPLVLAVAMAGGAALLYLWAVDGAAVARRAAGVAALGTLLVGAASSYWLVPFLLQVSHGVDRTLAAPTSWTWTEGRATIGNALWLNTTWGWRYAYYYPYAPQYAVLPLRLLRYAPAAIAFGTLVGSARGLGGVRRLRLVVLTAALVLLVIFVSTGTRPPGSLLFDPLYSLPYGWLLREPGRFLVLAAVGYGILVACTADALVRRVPHLSVRPPGRRRRWRLGRPFAIHLAPRLGVAVVLAVVAAAIPGYPMVTGVMTGAASSPLPSPRVRLPAFWQEMARLVDAQPPGGVLLLPPDDFLYMGYRWGYYAADVFATYLIDHPVVMTPVSSYFARSQQAVGAVTLVGRALVDRRWDEARAVLRVLGAKYLLVRGDIDSHLPYRDIIDPAVLARRLREAPGFRHVGARGPLDLFVVSDLPQGAWATSRIAAVDVDTPDLRILGALVPGTALVSGSDVAASTRVVQLPPLAGWTRQRRGGDEVLETKAAIPTGWSYRVVPLVGSGPLAAEATRGAVEARDDRNVDGTVHVVARVGASLLVPASGPGGWSPVGDCNDYSPPGAQISAQEVADGPHGTPALRLVAHHDAACVTREVRWQGGPVLVDLLVRHVAGPDPALCLWETALRRCADTPSLPSGSAWTGYQQQGPRERFASIPSASSWTRYRRLVTPDPGAGDLVLFLYAFGDPSLAPLSIAEYADVHVDTPLLTTDTVDVVATAPTSASDPQVLTVLPTQNSPRWQSTPPARQVLVDGMAPGWLASRPVAAIRYTPAVAVRLGEAGSAAVAIALVGAAVVAAGLRGRRFRHRR